MVSISSDFFGHTPPSIIFAQILVGSAIPASQVSSLVLVFSMTFFGERIKKNLFKQTGSARQDLQRNHTVEIVGWLFIGVIALECRFLANISGCAYYLKTIVDR